MIAPRRNTAQAKIQRYGESGLQPESDVVTVEEPMEIRLTLHENGKATERSVAVTMRTPGDDFELAAGFLFTEGLIAGRGDIADIRYCRDQTPQEFNIVSVRLRDPESFDPALLTRNFYMTSSCGVCGKASLEAVEIRGCKPLPDGTLRVPHDVVRAVPTGLLAAQRVFGKTGGLHAAALFDPEGVLSVAREDVGRHNAVDKVIGHELLDSKLPVADRFLAVSGRASFEIMQKALAAGVAMVVAVGAPSSLAVDVADRFNMTLVGFTRPESFNVYAGGSRLAAQGPAEV
jgi:FdhD protein